MRAISKPEQSACLRRLCAAEWRKIKTLSLKREADKWFLVIACEVPQPEKIGNVLPAVGLDVGLTQFATTSDGEKIANPRFLKIELPQQRRAHSTIAFSKEEGRTQPGKAASKGQPAARSSG